MNPTLEIAQQWVTFFKENWTFFVLALVIILVFRHAWKHGL